MRAGGPGGGARCEAGSLARYFTFLNSTPQRHGNTLKTSERSCPACSTPLPVEAQFCLHCGVATPTDPGVPQRIAATGAFEVAQVTEALAGRYKVERVLGEGGMATVYLATDQKHKRKVAVKVMRPELAATLGAERFLREVEIAAQLSHPHILPMYDSGEADGLLYYVMPYVRGRDAAREAAARGRSCRWTMRCAWRARWRRRWPTRTGRASSIATSSRPTSC